MKNPIYLFLSITILSFSNIKAQTFSRIIAQSMYTFEDGSFNLIDSTKYNYSTTKRGGDLASKYIAFDRSESFIYNKPTSSIVKGKLSLQNFDIYNNRTVLQNSNFNLSIGAYENTETVYYYSTINDTLTSIVKQNWNPTILNWENASQQLFTHDASGNRNSMTLQFWNTSTSAWVNNERNLFEFDINSNMTGNTYQTWDMSSSSWLNIFKDSLSYSASNKTLSVQTQIWLSGAWQNNKNILYVYDASDFLIESQEQGWNNAISAWYNVKKYSYTNDASGNILTFINQNWNNTLSKWDTFNQRTYTYDSRNNMLSNTWSFWNATTSNFENSALETYTYDMSDNRLSEISALWDMSTSSWLNTEKLSSAYNSLNQKTYEQNEVWDPVGSTWIFRNEGQKFYYFYETYTNSIANAKVNNALLKLFPIPTTDVLNVQFHSEFQEPLKGQIINMEGRLIKQWSVNSTSEFKTTIPTNELAPGQYILQFTGTKNGAIKGEFQVMK